MMTKEGGAPHEITSDEESDLVLLPQNNTGEIVASPAKFDIICGRGKSVTHPGNVRFRRMISARKEEYQKSKRRDDKTRITQEIVDALQQGPEPSR
jgi:hypothetical protein